MAYTKFKGSVNMFLRCLNKCPLFFFTYTVEKHLVSILYCILKYMLDGKNTDFLELLQQMRCHTANSVNNTVHERKYNFSRRRKVIFYFLFMSLVPCVLHIYIMWSIEV